MDERVKVVLDFTGCKYIGKLFRKMRTKMEWDDDLGENLSALWFSIALPPSAYYTCPRKAINGNLGGAYP